jgi:hypothetical protein
VREIDLTASVDQILARAGRTGAIGLQSFIAAKRLHSPGRFVGVAGADLEFDAQLRLRSRRIDGVPSYGVTLASNDRIHAVVNAQDGLASAFEPFVSAPVCVHWTIASRRKEDGKPWATGERPFWEDFDTIVRATVKLAESTSVMMLRHRVGHALEMRFMVPTMIVDTEHLLVYSPISHVLSEVDWRVLRRRFEVGGAVVDRLVDVVSVAGVPAMIERYRSTGERVRAALERNFDQLLEIAEQHREWWSTTGQTMGTSTARP